MRILIRLVPTALLGAGAALLVSCGSSGTGLIPSANGTALQGDFEAVARVATSGDGSCSATESALGKTEQDFLALPATLDRGLRGRLQTGITNLRKQALEMCSEPAPSATSTTSSQTTTTPTTSTTTETPPTTSTTTSTPTSSQTTTTTTPPNQSGGTEALGEGQGEEGPGRDKGEESPGKGKGEAEDNGGANAGGSSPGGGQ
jgi:hypothetical protein